MTEREAEPRRHGSIIPEDGPGGEDGAAETCAPRPAAAESEDFVAPRGEAEEAVAEILSSLLPGEAPVGAADNFILRGGESLRAAQAARKIWDRFGRDVELRTILVGTVEDIAREVSGGAAGAEAE